MLRSDNSGAARRWCLGASSRKSTRYKCYRFLRRCPNSFSQRSAAVRRLLSARYRRIAGRGGITRRRLPLRHCLVCRWLRRRRHLLCSFRLLDHRVVGGGIPRDLAEAALAHSLGSTEASYRRRTAVGKRREVMENYSRWLNGKGAEVIALRDDRGFARAASEAP